MESDMPPPMGQKRSAWPGAMRIPCGATNCAGANRQGHGVSASAAATACAMHARASPRVQAHNGTSAAADYGCALRRPHEPSSATGRRVTPPELTSMSSGRACSEATSLLFFFFQCHTWHWRRM